MHRTTRMTGILIALQPQTRTAQSLADRFEVSPRTIHRDVEELIQIGVPIESRRGPGGGFSVPQSWWLAPTNLTLDEVQTLLMALEHLGSGGTTTHRALIEKLHAALQPGILEQALADESRPSVTSDLQEPDPQVIATLRRSIAEGSWARIDYLGGSQPGSRRIKPTSLHIASGRWYVHAIDERSGESRQFRLDRIAHTNRCLAPPSSAQIISHATSAPDYHAKDHPEIIAELTKRGRLFAQDHPDFRHHLQGNRLTFRCPTSELTYYARELLRCGTDVTIIGPDILRTLMTDRSEIIREHHRDLPKVGE